MLFEADSRKFPAGSLIPRVERRVDRIACRALLIGFGDPLAEQIRGHLGALADRPYQFFTSGSVAEATTAPHGRPDVAFIDLTSADHRVTSVEGFDRLGEEQPIIAVIVAGDEHRLQDTLRAEGVDYLVQGRFDGELLDRAIRCARDRFRLTRALGRKEQRFKRFLADSGDGALVASMQGELLYANGTATELLPMVKLGEPLAKVGFDVPGPSEELQTLSDGRTVEVKSRLIEWEDRQAWLLILRDTSTRRQLEDLKARLAQSDKLAVIGQLAAGVAHEINNPLAFVLANLSASLGHVHQFEDVMSGLVDESRAIPGPGGHRIRALVDKLSPGAFAELREMIEDNLDGMDRIRTIVKELKAFSRRESEERELVRVHEMVKSACHMVSSQIRHRATLELDLEEVQPVMGNRVKLVQILTNLLMNAAQALPDHRGRQERITVSTRQKDRLVVISVSDTGTGIEESVRDRIFEPFFTTKPRGLGTGIGLSLSAELARQHDGELSLEQTSPAGTTFELRLPAAESMRLVHNTNDVSAPPEAKQPTRRRILLVEDEPYVRKSMIRMLREYEVVSANNGREALEALEADTFDAVVCDLHMPDLDGVDVHEALSRHNPEMLGRIIYTSGGAYTPRTAAFVNKNDITFIEKPIIPQRMFDALADVFKLD